MSQQYIGAVVILLISLLKIFKVDIAESDVTTVVTGLVALWVAFRRYQNGDINVFGSAK